MEKKPQPNKKNKSQEHQGDKSDLTACICSANNAACTEDALSHDSDTNHEENSSYDTKNFLLSWSFLEANLTPQEGSAVLI